MQIVINISKGLYDRYKEKDHIKKCDIDEFEKALDRCVILPEDHGRLIDADKILNHAHIEEDEDGDIFVKKWYCIEKDVFDNALVLIDGKRRKNE